MKDNLKVFLSNWGGLILEANVEEDLDQIKVAVKYNDRGDEFLLVKTNDDQCYEYGWWLNRCGTPDYSDLDGYYKNYFIRKPVLFKKLDVHSSESNRICFEFDNKYTGILNRSTCSIIKCSNQTEAQRRFDYVCSAVDGVTDRVIWFHGEEYKCNTLEFLKVNGIDTEDNLRRVNEINWDSKINGIHGFAGKRSGSSDYIGGDEIEWVFYRKRFINGTKVSAKHYVDYDEWGEFDRFGLSLNQFK